MYLGGSIINRRGGKIKLVLKISLVLILSLCILTPGYTPGDFEYRAEYNTGDSPHLAQIADFDGDSDLDIVTADYYADNISILVNNGEGIFSKMNDYKTGEGPRSIFAADVDSDLDLDVVSANYHDDSISVLKNYGDGSFAPRIDYDVGLGPYSIFLADIGEDANGDLDIITADEQAFKISVLENDGNGAYNNRKTYTVGSKPKSVFMDDLTGDGYNDIAVANWADHSVSILINKGDGTFKRHVEYDTGDGPRFLSLADLDGDDDVDLVTANQHADSISVLMNYGDGTFSSKSDYLVGDNPISVLTGDIDHDADYDILTTNLINDTITVLKNNGNGYYDQRREYLTDSGPYCALLADINDDGKHDIITANSYADTISVLYSNYPPTISILEPKGGSNIANSSYIISWEDFAPYTDAEISLYWDDDDKGLNGTQIASKLSEDDDGISGFYLWNISQMPEGDYWVYAKIDDGTFEPRFNYSAGPLTINHLFESNIPPTFHISEPDGNYDISHLEFTIFWMDSDPDNDATISLYYDSDDNGFDGALIIEGLSENSHGNSGIYAWNTSQIQEGEYYIYGICDDGTNEPIRKYGSFPLIVNHTYELTQTSSTNNNSLSNVPPFIQIIEPDGETHYSHKEYMITWIDSDKNDDASISLYYDPDFSGYDGTLIISGLSEDEHGNSGMYIWNTTLIPNGEYFIYAIIDDGLEVSRDYSPGMIIVDHIGNFNTVPKILMVTPEIGVEKAHKNYTLQWVDSDSDDNASISLYYDKDPGGYDGILIVSGLDEDEENDTFIWDTSNIPSGEYYLFAKIEDNVNKPAYDYSDGRLIIDHETDSKKDEGENKGISQSIFLILPLAILLILILIFFLSKKRKHDKGKDEKIESMDEERDSDEFEIPQEDLIEDDIDEEFPSHLKETEDEELDL
jgi:hypothetical protein